MSPTEHEQMVAAIVQAWQDKPADYPDVRDDAAIAIAALRDGGWLPAEDDQ